MIVSMYPPESDYKIFSNDAWWSDTWDGLEFGRDFDFSRPFFDQFRELSLQVPRVALMNPKAENAPYCNFADGNKNCHLVINSNFNQDSYYSTILVDSRSCCDCMWVVKSELCYECCDLEGCYAVRFSRESMNCSDSLFLSECRGCSQCIGCVNLRNKRLYIFNTPVTEEEFLRVKRSLRSRDALTRFSEKFEQFRLSIPHPGRHLIQCEESHGDHLSRCRNMHQSFEGFDSQDCSYSNIFSNMRDCYDCNATNEAELSLENTSFMGSHHLFTAFCRGSSDLLYCWDCHVCSDCFGCIGLRNKQYCILNKQYAKEEYEKLVPMIIQNMQNDGNGADMNPSSPTTLKADTASGSWGEFFPVTMSPFAYNDTVAQEFFSLTQGEILGREWRLRDGEEAPPTVDQVIPAPHLPDSIDDSSDDVLQWVIACEATHRPFKIIRQELELYRKIGVPIPCLHPDERHRRRVASRNPSKLWRRNCQKCGREMETSYDPGKKEIVNCEECFLKEVY